MQITEATHLQQPDMAALLLQHHKAFTDYINALPEEEFVYAANGKWTAGQQLQHILLSVQPLNQVFRLPKFIIRMLFGTANRPGKSYEALVEKYKLKLQQGGRAAGRFVPKKVSVSQRAKRIQRLQKAVRLLCRQLAGFSEQQLDTLILPHPLLGKVTLREMIYFTIYHVVHHHEATKKNLAS